MADPTPDRLLDLEPGERVRITLDDGESTEATVRDPRRPRGRRGRPNLGVMRLGNGVVSVPIDVAGARRVLHAHHEDKNPKRRRDETTLEIPSIRQTESGVVVSIEFLE